MIDGFAKLLGALNGMYYYVCHITSVLSLIPIPFTSVFVNMSMLYIGSPCSQCHHLSLNVATGSEFRLLDTYVMFKMSTLDESKVRTHLCRNK